jgi:putative addiction module component (TIGR02574 family)
MLVLNPENELRWYPLKKLTAVQTPIMAKPEIDINKLSPEERLDLIEELWASLSTDPAKIPLTEAQANELDRRMAEMDHDDSLGIPWETVLARIRERK